MRLFQPSCIILLVSTIVVLVVMLNISSPFYSFYVAGFSLLYSFKCGRFFPIFTTCMTILAFSILEKKTGTLFKKQPRDKVATIPYILGDRLSHIEINLPQLIIVLPLFMVQFWRLFVTL